MGKWTFSDPNPIVGYTVGIELARPLSPPVLGHISALHARFRRDLPRRLNQQAFTFQVGVPAQQPSQPAITGVVFDSLLPDGRTKMALSVHQSVLTFMVGEYSRWVEFWPLADRLLREVGGPALDEAPARALVLIANNRFTWSNSDSKSGVDISMLLRPAQKYVPPYLLGRQGSCHSFLGYTVDNSDPAGKRTDNVILAVQLSDEGQFLDLNFNIRLELAAPQSRQQLFEGSDGGQHCLLERTLDDLHELNKGLMRNVLLDSVAQTIPGLCN
jgi:uncharacterized protein (TIGR04255 family)